MVTTRTVNEFNNAGFITMIKKFSKTITRTAVTKTTSNSSGVETLTEGSTNTILGALFRKEDAWSQDKMALFQNADAILLIQLTETLNKDDKITYDSENYRVDKITTRRLGEVEFYKVAQLFKI
jgi:hypothetical protein